MFNLEELKLIRSQLSYGIEEEWHGITGGFFTCTNCRGRGYDYLDPEGGITHKPGCNAEAYTLLIKKLDVLIDQNS